MIWFVSGEYPPAVGGVGDYTLRLRAALDDKGCTSTVVSREHVRRWDARALLWFVRHAPEVGIVHIQYQAGAFDLLGDICLLPLLLRRLRPGIRSVTTFHDVRVPYLFPKAGRLRPAALRLLARTSHAFLAADERDLRSMGGGFHVPIGPNVNCEPPDAYDRAAFRRAHGLDGLVIVYFGMLNASKGLDALVETVEGLPAATLLLVGSAVGASDPTDRAIATRLRARIDTLGARVTRTGWLKQPELSAYLLAGDVALLPYADGASARRGSLLACAEHGLPIVSTLPTGAEVADAVRAVEPEALSEAVLEVANDPQPWRARSKALAKRVCWSRIAAAHLDIYDRLVQRRQ